MEQRTKEQKHGKKMEKGKFFQRHKTHLIFWGTLSCYELSNDYGEKLVRNVSIENHLNS